MSQEKPLNIIKGAILLEYKGKAFYETALQNTKSEAVREIFNTLADEEKKHIDILEEQYGNLMQKGKLKAVERDEKPMDISSVVITEKVQQEVSAVGYEAAAISAAMELEKRAVRFYSEHASSTDDQVAKELYQWLGNWEKTHLTFLSELDRELMESIWYDNKFWPVI